jgi:hypothetical protein
MRRVLMVLVTAVLTLGGLVVCRTRCSNRHAGQGLEHLDPRILQGRFLRAHATVEPGGYCIPRPGQI